MIFNIAVRPATTPQDHQWSILLKAGLLKSPNGCLFASFKTITKNWQETSFDISL
jgi:hypothetical protein